MDAHGRFRRALALTCVLAGTGLGPSPARAADAPATPAWLSELTLNGFVSTSYSYNLNRPDSRTNQLRVFDIEDATFQLDEFELVAQRAAALPRETGFRVDMTLGSSVSRVAASSGLFRDTSGVAGDLDVHQAFVSYLAPFGRGVRFDAGKFVTPAGIEVVDGYDGWNDQATRSLLFGYAIPFTHVGLRVSGALTSRVSAMVMVVNGWDVARDDNRAKTLGGQLSLAPGHGVSVALTGIWGPERPNDDSDARTLLDGVASWTVGERLTLGANADWGRERMGPGVDARWNGVAGYLRAGLTPCFALCARAEAFADLDGARTGIAQKLSSFTLTPECRLGRGLIVRGDARLDHSDQPVFEKRGGTSHDQPTLLGQVSYHF